METNKDLNTQKRRGETVMTNIIKELANEDRSRYEKAAYIIGIFNACSYALAVSKSVSEAWMHERVNNIFAYAEGDIEERSRERGGK